VGYQIGFPSGGYWKEAFNRDAYDHWVNPTLAGNAGGIEASSRPMHGFETFASVIPARRRRVRQVVWSIAAPMPRLCRNTRIGDDLRTAQACISATLLPPSAVSPDVTVWQGSCNWVELCCDFVYKSALSIPEICTLFLGAWRGDAQDFGWGSWLAKR